MVDVINQILNCLCYDFEKLFDEEWDCQKFQILTNQIAAHNICLLGQIIGNNLSMIDYKLSIIITDSNLH